MPELVSKQKDDVLVVQFISQKILSDVLIAQIGRELRELADQAGGKMVLDFQGVTFMSSTMFGELSMLCKKCKREGIALKFCCISPTIMDVFEITHFLTKRQIRAYKTVDEAIGSFRREWFQ